MREFEDHKFILKVNIFSFDGKFFYLYTSIALFNHHETTLSNYQGYALAVGHHNGRNQHSKAEIMNPKRNFHWAPVESYPFYDE